MWPCELQMSRDECRGILRRLELDSYSNVISVFRAQGGLNDSKAKVLEELRGIFHISPERHRAEARRVANDEQLSTIAEAISGPNTWQEWSREGRRIFPMLPRVAPQTALSLIANSIASETAMENSKLPYPTDTAKALIEEQTSAMKDSANTMEVKQDGYVVTDDPFKMPDIPVGPKKNLKRVSVDGQAGGNKKRMIIDVAATKKQSQHITANNSNISLNASASNIRKLYHSHNSKLQQQRQSHNPQITKQKVPSKKSSNTPSVVASATAIGKRQVTPAKAGRKSHIKLQEQKLLMQQQQMASQNQTEFQNVHNIMDKTEEAKDQKNPTPQIAASKKDISKNLSKLQLPGVVVCSSSGTTASMSPTPSTLSAQITGPTRLDSHQVVTSPTVTSALFHGKIEKQLISTPVQKIIIEERLPPSQQLSSTMQQQTSSTPQIMTLPQISAAATKLRAINTTILPPGTKVTAKRMTVSGQSGIGILGTDHVTAGVNVSGSSVNQSQVFNIIDSAMAPTVPTHTPPAIIQLQSNTGGSNEATAGLQHPTQSKVLTTKLLPIVLSGSGTGSVNTANITKIETLNNGATIVAAGLGSVSSSPNSSVGTTIIKNVSPTLLLSPNQSSSSSSLFSALGTGASAFRKTPLIKTGTLGMNTGGSGKISTNFSPSNTGPQIISNIKLSPAITTTAVSTTHSNQQPHQFLQHQLKTVSTTGGLRTNVKICQSPNGKVFIQPADASTKAKLQGGLQHKILPNTIVGAGPTAPSQRISIQKVQIIPAPIGAPGNLSTNFQTSQSHLQQSQITKSTASLNLGGNKGNMNMVFMSTPGSRNTTGTITIGKSNTGGGVGTLVTGKVQESGKPNLVIIGAAQNATTLKSSNYNDSTNKILSATTAVGNVTTIPLDDNQMITEDTPVDILNMPIIVESDDGTNVTMGNNIGDTVTVLPPSLIENATNTSGLKQTQHQHHHQQKQHQTSTVILGATDWEMELDQATAVAAATKARTIYQHPSKSNTGRNIASKQETNTQKLQLQNKDVETIIIDDSFEDVIVEEQEEGEVGDAGCDENEGEDGQIMGEKEYSILPASHTEVMPLKQINTQEPKEELKTTRLRSYDGPLLEVDEPIEIIDDEEKDKNNITQNSEKNDTILDIGDSRDLNATIILSDSTVNTFTNTIMSERKTDIGFGEATVTEIDENTAIEYIEEDHSATHTDDDVTGEKNSIGTELKTTFTLEERRDRKNGSADNTEVDTKVITRSAPVMVETNQLTETNADASVSEESVVNTCLAATTTTTSAQMVTAAYK